MIQHQEDRPYPTEPLTRREQEILEHLEEGLTNREIAEALVIAESTVKGYTRQIYQKLGVNSRSKAVQRAREGAALRASQLARWILARIGGKSKVAVRFAGGR